MHIHARQGKRWLVKPNGSDGPCEGRVCKLKRGDWQTGGLSPKPSSAPEFLGPLNQTCKCSVILRPKLWSSWYGASFFKALLLKQMWNNPCSASSVPMAWLRRGSLLLGLPAASIPVLVFLVCRISHGDSETRDFAAEISCDFHQLMFSKRGFDTVVQRNTQKQILFCHSCFFFSPSIFMLLNLFFLYMGTAIINYVFVMHANSGNFAPADCMHFAFLLCTIQKERGSNYYTGVLYCTVVKECSFVFCEPVWICVAGTRTRRVLCPSMCRLHNLQSRRESTNKFVYYGHCRGWELATSSGLQQMLGAPVRCSELEG